MLLSAIGCVESSMTHFSDDNDKEKKVFIVEITICSPTQTPSLSLLSKW